MTPTQHKAQAETLLDQATASTITSTTDELRARAEVHAVLAKTAGTGEHYDDADLNLTALAGTAQMDRRTLLADARVHALLAD